MRQPTDDEVDYEAGYLPPSPYDTPPLEDFSAPPVPEAADWDVPTPAGRREAMEPSAWARAEAAQGRALVRAAEAVARLDERLRRMEAGALRRLALEEAEALARLEGRRLPPGRLALFDAWAARGTEEDSRALSAAHWALRRLTAGRPPESGGLAAFLGRRTAAPAPSSPSGPPGAGAFGALAARWEAGWAGAGDLHPLTRAALVYHLWRGLALSEPGASLEPATVAALEGARDLPGGLRFLPLARAGNSALTASGAPATRLAAWYAGLARGALSALMLLDRLEVWRAQAAAETADLSGRTPARLLDAAMEMPLLAASEAAALAGCSRAAAERNLALLEGRGLLREMTGQGRFRLWSAAI